MSNVKLESTARGQSFVLRGTAAVVGRAHDCDFPLLDPSVSRRHAQVVLDGDHVRIRDLGSSNGTFVNGTRVSTANASLGDVVAFGRVEFAVREVGKGAGDAATVAAAAVSAQTTIIKQVHLDAAGNRPTAEAMPVGADATRETQLLLVDFAKELVGQSSVDVVLDRFADMTLDSMPVDCVSLQLLDPSTGELVPGASKSRLGAAIEVRRVPTSISSRVVRERIAVLTDNAPADVRFGGSSIVVQSVRSAMCTPLMGSDGTVLGIFYVDSRTADRAFGDEDLSFLISFAGIAAAAIESRTAKKRWRLARHFSPEQAAQLAGSDSTRFEQGLSEVTALAVELDGVGDAANQDAETCAGFLAHFTRGAQKIVFDRDGSVDRSMTGDLVAFWGTPVAGEHDTDRCMDAATALRDLVTRLNARWMDGHGLSVRVRIGVASGLAMCGNIGSDRDPDYVVIGRSLEHAQRLSALASPGEILFTESVYTRLATKPTAASRVSLPSDQLEDVGIYRLSR